MKIGLIADTHDDYPSTVLAIQTFQNRHCDMVIHVGDFASRRIFDLFMNAKTQGAFDFQYVLGFNPDRRRPSDNHDQQMFDREKFYGDYIADSQLYLDLTTKEGLRIGAFHDTYLKQDGNIVYNSIEGRAFDYFFYGHIHLLNFKYPDEYYSTVVINPGSFYYPNMSTFVILDTGTKRFSIFYLNEKQFHEIIIVDLATKQMRSTSKRAELVLFQKNYKTFDKIIPSLQTYFDFDRENWLVHNLRWIGI